MKSNPKDQPLQEEFKKNANSYISFFERSGKLRFAKIIAANYEIFDRLIGFSDEKELITHISTFGKSPEFVKCLYSHYLKLGKNLLYFPNYLINLKGKVSALLEDPLFHDYLKDNELLYSLHCLTREEYLSSYNKYVALSLNEKDLYERKRLVSMRKIIACQLDMNTKAEKQMLEIIKLQVRGLFFFKLPADYTFLTLLGPFSLEGNADT